MRKPRNYIDSLIFEIAEEMAASTINRMYLLGGIMIGFVLTLPFSLYIIFTILVGGSK